MKYETPNISFVQFEIEENNVICTSGLTNGNTGSGTDNWEIEPTN